MPVCFTACCCKSKVKPVPSISSDSPNVIDVHINPEDKFAFPILTQPRLRKDENPPIVLRDYENEPKGYNNFAYVDEIDVAKKKVQTDNNQIPTISKSVSFKEIPGDDNQVDKSSTKSPLPFSTTYSIDTANKSCTVTVLRNGVETIQIMNIEDSSIQNEQFYHDIRVNAERMAKSLTDQFQSLLNPVDHIIDNTTTTTTTTTTNIRNKDSVNDNTNTNKMIENAFQNFIKETHLTPHLPALRSSNADPCYAKPKIHEDELVLPTVRPAKQRKFPNAFDDKLIKAKDLKRKPPPSSADPNELQNIGSPYRYAAFRLATLEAHNYFRLKHGCGPLVESQVLNEIAEDWANNLASTHSELYHRPNNKYGENLYWSNNLLCHGRMAVQAWYDEIELYDYNNPGFSNEVGHFTQLLWTDTKEVGTAIATIGNMSWVVCNYNPPGNVMGQFDEFHVPRPK